ncbi:uncharacterized protein LOC101754058 [Setaria italica]|uniref:uncharacterized protein LOC101754058 n=1 Tax=Setaria italica TaxID=4555 RepID=UPI000350DD65|nr:uncharacterized protein LOC101754058 [Setaria italica]
MLEWYRKKDPKATLVTGENASRNNQMSSPMVQKDLARACAEETIELIKSEIGDRWFAVLVDEAHDASIKEQMVVVVRFVNDKGSVIERFLSIEHVSDTTSTSLKEALDTMLRRYGLSISKIRGQGYDGASNMRGQFHGLQRLLVVVSVAKCCGSTFDFFNYVTSIVNVVSASCKRKDQLLQSHHDKLVEQLDSSAIFSGRRKNQETSLARPGDTRWVQKLVELAKIYKDDFCDYDCIKLVGDLRIFIDEVRNDDNFDTCTDLGNLAEKMVQTGRDTTFPLVYHLIELALILPVAIATVE